MKFELTLVWHESVERERKVEYGEVRTYREPQFAMSAWRNLKRMDWLKPHQYNAYVSSVRVYEVASEGLTRRYIRRQDMTGTYEVHQEEAEDE